MSEKPSIVQRDLSSTERFLVGYPSFLSSFVPIAAKGFQPEGLAGNTGGTPWAVTDPEVTSLIPTVEWHIFKCWTRHLEASLTIIHAAVLGKEGRALLLPAVTGSGKTTLALSLLSRGYTYISDDCAILGPEPDTLWPAPGAAHIKSELWPGHSDFLEAVMPYASRFYSHNTAYCGFVKSDYLPQPGERWKVACIVFLGSRRPEKEPVWMSVGSARRQETGPHSGPEESIGSGRLARVRPGRAVSDMMFHSFSKNAEHFARDFRLLAALLRLVPVYRLQTEDLGEAGQALDDLLDGRVSLR